MIIHEATIRDNIHIYYADSSDIDINALMPGLSQLRCKKIHQLKKDNAKKCCAVAGLLLDYAAQKNLWNVHIPVEYHISKYGKPILDGYYFNLSHSGSMVICAVANNSIGIDIQQIRQCRNRIIDKYFTADEKALIDCDSEFTRLWARKEAIAKADGRGLARIISCIDVSRNIVVVNNVKYQITDLPDINDFKVALAVALE